ncbi:MAG TPA: biosynthetic-type acetolactate synthase large subunit [Clostridiales bacterium]|nr:biosynthetic-type acetolactate synthase large subunit [Clostridiales bacterium]
MMKITGSKIVIECLKEQGVDIIFGYPGGAILNIYDELYKQDDVKHVLTAHEQAAAHAADGYARATGKVGVCFATSGPGATNLVTGIATAYMDSIPMVAITANVATGLLGKDSFQEVDIAGITMPITKHNYIVKDVTLLADIIRKAFVIAKSGRPGPVLIDITKDVTAAETEYNYVAPVEVERCTKNITDEDIDKAVKLINKAKKPFILVGGGAVLSDAYKELEEFIDKVNAPITDTLMAKGSFDGTNPLYTGMIGMHGSKASNLGVTKCDLLITIGARFSDRVIGKSSAFAKRAKILQIDIDPAEIDKNVITHSSVIGDIKEVLKIINTKIDKLDHSEWNQEVMDIKEQFPLTYHKDILTGPYIMEKLYEITKGDAIITTEVGQHQMWAAQFYHYRKERTFITSGGLGTMGYGLGASMGAKLGRPDMPVFNIAGDGCFRMNLNEIATASRYKIPIIEVVFNNHVLGMVRQWQNLFYGERYSYTTFDDGLDFVKIAEALGATGYKVTKKEELEDVIRKALKADGPVVIDCHIDCDEKVWPMVAPGAGINEVFNEDDLAEKNFG